MRPKASMILLILFAVSPAACFLNLDDSMDLSSIPDLPTPEEVLAGEDSLLFNNVPLIRKVARSPRKTKKLQVPKKGFIDPNDPKKEQDEEDSDDQANQKAPSASGNKGDPQPTSKPKPDPKPKPKKKVKAAPAPKKDDSGTTDLDDDEDPLEDSCNPELLRAFGINVRGKVKPMNNTDETLAYCRWNRMTCCTPEDFGSFKKFFHKGLRKMYQELYMTEQLLLMFNAKQEIITFEKLKKKESCHVYLEEVKDSKGVQIYPKNETGTNRFFNDTVRAAEIYKGSLLKSDVRENFTSLKFLYASLMCTLCSSLDHSYITLSTVKSTVRVNHMTMDKFLELLDFEVRLAKFLHYYVRPLANVIRCANDWLDRVDYSIEAIDIVKVETVERLVYYCTLDSHRFKNFCQGLLRLNLYGRMGLFNYPNIVKQSLKVLFEQFFLLEIEKFYRDYFGATFRLNEEVYTNFYDKHNEEAKKYKLMDVQVTLEEDGMDLVENDISPPFFDMEIQREGAGRWGIGLLVALLFWLIN